MKLTTTVISVASLCLTALSAVGQTDAYIKLFDHHGKHPRINSIEYPGNANWLDAYNSIYGHGAVIENPWVAYRIYIDNRQSLDLYVKHTPKLELDITGFYTTPLQLEEGYGCDVLWAGKSIAAGSFRGYRNGEILTIDSVGSRAEKVIDSSTVRVIDKDWIYNGHPIQMEQTYHVLPDSRDLFVEIRLEGHKGDDIFCTGVQKLESGNTGFLDPKGSAASWGNNIPDKAHPELVETVGLGIIVDPANVSSVKEDDLNYLIFVKPDDEGFIRYRIIACGTREKDGIKDSATWFDYISKETAATHF